MVIALDRTNCNMEKLYVCLLLTLSLVLLIQETNSADAAWNHDISDTSMGPHHWKTNYATCGGRQQSPVHVRVLETEPDPTRLGEFTFEEYNSSAIKMKLKNTGHGPKVDLGEAKLWMREPGLGHTYILHQFHIHSGNGTRRGSEHLLDEGDYSAEIHFVFFKEGVNPDNILTTDKGLAVLGVLLKAGGWENDKYAPLLAGFDSVIESGSETELTSFNPWDLLPTDLDKYFRYDGSLTTPPCSEVVQWTLFRDAIYLSDSQIRTFMKLSYGDNDVTYTYRPIQQLFDRKIYNSWLPKPAPPISIGGAPGLYTGCTLAILVSALIVLLH